jgi:hypothetical protein
MTKVQSISRVVKGVTLKGTYTVQDGIVTLTTAFGNKTARLGKSKPASLAFVMLRELYEGMGAIKSAAR